MYFEGKLLLLPRDEILFTRKTLEERQRGDADTSLCWLRSLEIALTVCEKQRTKEAKQASKFFQRFRAMGRQKLQENRLLHSLFNQEAGVQARDLSTQIGTYSQQEGTPHKQREEEQLRLEISGSTQQSYKREASQPALDGLQHTILRSIFEDEGTQLREEGSDVSGIVSSGPFGAQTILQYAASTDSSYVQSRQRDVEWSYDTFTSSGTEVTPEGYRSDRRRLLLDRMDDIIQRLDNTTLEVDQQPTVLTSLTADSEDDLTREIFTEEADRVSGDHSTSTEASGNTFLFMQRLRFPLNQIAHETQQFNMAIPQFDHRSPDSRTDDNSITSDSSSGTYIPLEVENPLHA